jgi:NTE family protein
MVFGDVARRVFGGERRVDATEARSVERPQIGLALGGGAARGWAHIGVLRAFMAAGIKPDVIAGTSVGAVVGGCYAAGRLDELEEFARSLTRRRVFGLMDFSLSGSGVISGDRLFGLLHAGLRDITIEELPLRFLAIASELRTGHEIWLGKGKLVTALRASCALPGVFPPAKVAGRWLVDGALVNPVPVSPCRALGANIVIAVNLSTDILGRGTVIANQDLLGTNGDEEPAPPNSVRTRRQDADQAFRRGAFGRGSAPGLLSVMFDAFNIIQDRIARSRLAGDPPDVMIGPRLQKIGLFEFDRAAESIDLGRDAAQRAIAQISEATLVSA